MTRSPAPLEYWIFSSTRTTYPVGFNPTELLPRKEVIQPHLPVQLPCYDFVPVTGPTLGRCLPCGLAHGLQALSASMT